MKRSESHVPDVQRCLKSHNSCPISSLSLQNNCWTLLTTPCSSFTYSFPIWHSTFCYDSKCPPDTMLVHVLLHLHLLLIKEGYLGWLENDTPWQGKEACKLETPFHSIPINFCPQQNRKKRACEPSTEGQRRFRFLPKMLEIFFFCFPLNSQSDWHFSTYLSMTNLFYQQL